MRTILLATSLVLDGLAAMPASAQRSGPATAPKAATQAPVATTPAQSNGAALSPDAREAVKVVNDFMGALASGQLENARQLMTPDAAVIANGHVLGNRDSYINGAAKGDATALASVQRELLRRDVKAGPNVGWVLSEKRLSAPGAGKDAPGEVVTETMLVAKTAQGWKITHIHWSGRHG